jgi:hypothetical protein
MILLSVFGTIGQKAHWIELKEYPKPIVRWLCSKETHPAPSDECLSGVFLPHLAWVNPSQGSLTNLWYSI